MLPLPESKRVADRRQGERAGELERIAVMTRVPVLLLDLAEIVDDVLPLKDRENGGASLGIFLNLLLVPAQRVAWLDPANAKRAFPSFVV